ncbi:hypothetical protein DFH09DRAFT_1090028 [Mycena vulgaris]|nr:hypothetical protein DFH09DRAFT_1090028 [Mycena vulgaris]
MTSGGIESLDSGSLFVACDAAPKEWIKQSIGTRTVPFEELPLDFTPSPAERRENTATATKRGSPLAGALALGNLLVVLAKCPAEGGRKFPHVNSFFLNGRSMFRTKASPRGHNRIEWFPIRRFPGRSSIICPVPFVDDFRKDGFVKIFISNKDGKDAKAHICAVQGKHGTEEEGSLQLGDHSFSHTFPNNFGGRQDDIFSLKSDHMQQYKNDMEHPGTFIGDRNNSVREVKLVLMDLARIKLQMHKTYQQTNVKPYDEGVTIWRTSFSLARSKYTDRVQWLGVRKHSGHEEEDLEVEVLMKKNLEGSMGNEEAIDRLVDIGLNKAVNGCSVHQCGKEWRNDFGLIKFGHL